MSRQVIITGNCLDQLKTLPDGSVHCCVTSPPYWGLRDYGTANWIGGDSECDHVANPNQTKKMGNEVFNENRPSRTETKTKGYYEKVCPKCGAIREDDQLGLEETPEAYVESMVKVFREVHRVLRDDGTLWLNLGDSYCGTGHKGDHKDPKHKGGRNAQSVAINNKIEGLKSKDLVGIPWRVAFALQADGWYLRQDIIWHKPNPMPESVTDRCTKAHEYIFLLSKSKKYYYDHEAIKEPLAVEPHAPRNKKLDKSRNDHDQMEKVWGADGKRNKRSVWTVTTKPYKGAHFATFPHDLIEPCILAGTSKKGCCAKCGMPWNRVVESVRIRRDELDKSDPRYRPNRYESPYKEINGREDAGFTKSKTLGWNPSCSCDSEIEPCTVLDPFLGSGTTLAVALKNGRQGIGIELNQDYVEISHKRIEQSRTLFTLK